MRIDDLRPTENTDDRRGESYGGGGGGFGPRMVMGGGGLGFLAVVLVVSWLTGADPTQLLNGGDPVSAPQRQEQAGPRADDDDILFARRIIGSAEDVWQP